MTALLLVGLDEHERDAVGTATPATWLDPEDLDDRLARLPDIDVVVVGGGHPARAVAVVQQVHRTAPDALVGVLVTADSEAEVRRHVRFAAGVPADLDLLRLDDPGLPGRVGELCRTAARRRSHDQALAGIGAREASRPASTTVVRASLGTLLEHAPMGAVVADLERRILACNRSAAQLLQLHGDIAGSPLDALFLDTRLVDRLVQAASTVDASDPWPEETTLGPNQVFLDVSAAMTQLDDGRDVVMLLLGDASDRRDAEHARDVLSDQVAMMGRVSEALVGTQDPDEALHLIAAEVVPTLSDWVSMQLYDERGETRLVVARHSDPAMAELTAAVEGRLPSAVSEDSPSRRLARGESAMLLPHITEEMLERFFQDAGTREGLQEIGVDSAIAVPLDGRHTRVGSMVLVNRATSPKLGDQELAIAVEVGRRVGIALETLHLYSRQRALAEELQRSMLTAPPTPEHAEIAVRYLPASHEAQVGGDWYDAYLQPDGSIVLTIGDVVGHDYRAAAAMGQLRGLLRGIGYARGRGPAAMLRSLDAAIEGLLPGTTATSVVAHVSAPGSSAAGEPLVLRWSNAGHPPPILVPSAGDPTVLAAEDTDVLLGVVPEVSRQEVRTGIVPGDTLLLYSDGLIERRGRDFDEGLTELRQVVAEAAGLPLDDLCDHVLTSLVQREHDDDVALVALRLR